MTPQPNTNYVPRAAWELIQKYNMIANTDEILEREDFLNGFVYAISVLCGWWEDDILSFEDRIYQAQPFPETEMWAVKDKNGRFIKFHSDNTYLEQIYDPEGVNSIVKVAIREVGGGE